MVSLLEGPKHLEVSFRKTRFQLSKLPNWMEFSNKKLKTTYPCYPRGKVQESSRWNRIRKSTMQCGFLNDLSNKAKEGHTNKKDKSTCSPQFLALATLTTSFPLKNPPKRNMWRRRSPLPYLLLLANWDKRLCLRMLGPETQKTEKHRCVIDVP